MVTNLPLILAGPILRRVESNRVCVWIATSKKVDITIDILQRPNITNTSNVSDSNTNNNNNNNKEIIEIPFHKNKPNPDSLSNDRKATLNGIGTGKNTFVQLGDCLFINILDAVPTLETKTRTDTDAGVIFPEDELLFYDLEFEVESEQSKKKYSLGDLGLLDGPNSISYASKNQDIDSKLGDSTTLEHVPFYCNVNLPGFFIPSKTANSKLNFLYGSCRKLHGDEEDNFIIADSILTENFFDLHKRPSALFLIGDQIYADNVAGPLINHITNLSKKIMGWDERIDGLDHPISSFKIGQRESKVKDLTQFSSDDMDNHLLGMGEFAAMYLTTWNHEIWPNEFKMIQKDDAFFDTKDVEKYELELMHLYQSRNALKSIRRLLANIPTYMICDDHEITDDWNINRKWYQSVVNSKAGNQVIVNGLVAYWAFQAWGNEPMAFDNDFKNLIQTYLKRRRHQSLGLENQQNGFNFSKDLIDKNSLGMNSIKKLEQQILDLKKWTFVAPTYPLSLFLDCRTQRKFVDEEGPPLLLSEQALVTAKDELFAKGYKYGDPLIIVSPTPVLGFELAESIQRFLTAISGSYKWDLETWRANEDGFVKLLTFIQDNFNPSFCVFLSGDVHYAFTMKGEIVKYDLVTRKANFGASRTDSVADVHRELNQVDPAPISEYKNLVGEKILSRLQLVQLTSSPFKSTSTENRFVAILILNLVHMMIIATRRMLINRCKFDYKRYYQWQFNKFVQTTDVKKITAHSRLKKPGWLRPKYYSEHNRNHQNLFSNFATIFKTLRIRSFVQRKSTVIPTAPHIKEARLLMPSNCFLSSPVLSSNNMGQVSLDYRKKMVRHTLLYLSGGKIKNKKIDVEFN